MFDQATPTEAEVVVDSHRASDAEELAVESRTTSDLQITGDWDRVRRYCDAARQFGRAQVACQVLAGLELKELKKRNGIRAGRPVDPSTPEWADLVAENAGVSDDTARRWMAMADAVRPRLKKLPGVGAMFRELLERPIQDLTQEQHLLLEQAVHKATDGMTQVEFLRELGIAKYPAGHGVKGGDRGGRRPPKSQTPPTEAELQSMARQDWGNISTIFDASRANFTMLNDFEVESQIAELELHLKARRAWLRVPKADRNEVTIADIAKMFVRPLFARTAEPQ